MFQPHLFQLDLELFGDQHRDRGIGPLPHLNIGHGQHDRSIAFDADESIGCKTTGAGRFGFREGQAQAEHQPSTRSRSGLQEAAPRETPHGSEQIEDHG